MYQMLNEVDDGVLPVRQGIFMTQMVHYLRPYVEEIS